MRRPVRSYLLLLAPLLLASCGDAEDTPTAPTPTPTLTVERFEGTVARNAADIHPFPSDGGTVTAKLVALSPESAVLGFNLGTWNGVSCALTITNTNATLNTVIVGQASGSGSLCVHIHDAGSVTEPTSYTIEVSHP